MFIWMHHKILSNVKNSVGTKVKAKLLRSYMYRVNQLVYKTVMNNKAISVMNNVKDTAVVPPPLPGCVGLVLIIVLLVAMVVVGVAVASVIDNENETAVVPPDCVGMGISLAVGVTLILIVGEGAVWAHQESPG